MKTNKYLHLWLPIMGLHALHQVEESISFWQWYIDFVDKIPSWLQLPRISENAHLVKAHKAGNHYRRIGMGKITYQNVPYQEETQSCKI